MPETPEIPNMPIIPIMRQGVIVEIPGTVRRTEFAVRYQTLDGRVNETESYLYREIAEEARDQMNANFAHRRAHLVRHTVTITPWERAD
jgi:hypothetical protein